MILQTQKERLQYEIKGNMIIYCVKIFSKVMNKECFENRQNEPFFSHSQRDKIHKFRQNFCEIFIELSSVGRVDFPCRLKVTVCIGFSFLYIIPQSTSSILKLYLSN